MIHISSRLLAISSAAIYLTVTAGTQGEVQPASSARTFATASEATNELIKAAISLDWPALREIFGPEVTNLMTGDKVLDDKHLEHFAADLTERCVTAAEGTSGVTLEIGLEKWPFPIPLVKTNGGWAFDTTAGEEEIMDRHIGRDEYFAIGLCRDFVKAQRDYASLMSGVSKPAYAMRFKSTPGKMDGLYWPADSSNIPSPLSKFLPQALLQTYDWSHGKGPRLFHGYVFKILTRQGPAAPGGKMSYVKHGRMSEGFALVAYPVRFGESGIMTFIVNQEGIVYQRSLGDKTAEIASRMKDYNPETGWAAVTEPGITDLMADSKQGPAH